MNIGDGQYSWGGKKIHEILALCVEFVDFSDHMFDVLVPGRALVSNPQNCHVAPSFRSSFGNFSKKIKETAVDITRVQLIAFEMSFNLDLIGLFSMERGKRDLDN